jgi:AcrR family transcriptional regulator
MDAHRAGIDLLWNDRRPPTRGPKPALSLDRIVAAAVAIADAEGLTAVSMERVATDLNFTKMSLYRYVPGKNELVALMIDRAIGDVPPSLSGLDGWRRRLHGWGQELFGRFVAHPWSLPGTVGARPIGPNELAWTEYAVAALDGLPLDPTAKLDTVAILAGHARSIAAQAAAMGDDPESHIGHMLASLALPRPDRYPALARAMTELLSGSTGRQNDALAFGLDRILDGLETYTAGKAH